MQNEEGIPDEEMEVIKRSRRPLRVEFDQLIVEITDILGQQHPDQRALRVNSELLNKNYARIDEYDLKLKQRLIDVVASEDMETAEYRDMRTYSRKYYTIKEDIIQKLENAKLANTDALDTASITSETKRRRFKLPEVKLQSFGGNLKEWLSWWSQFRKIDEDEEMHSTDKFEYLIGAMVPGSEVKQLVESYPRTEKNYVSAIAALNERYGRSDLLLQVYVRELLSLVIANVSNKEKMPLNQLYIQLESHLRSLTELQLQKADPATWLFPLVESSLPSETLRAWQRSTQCKTNGSKLNPPQTRLELLMDFMKTEVQCEQQIALAEKGFSQSKKSDVSKIRHPNWKRLQDVPTASGLFTSNYIVCAFCDGRHPTQECRKALKLTVEDRKKLVMEKKLCFKCLIPGHSWFNCRTRDTSCTKCGKAHNEMLCLQDKGAAISQPESGPVPEKSTSSEKRGFGLRYRGAKRPSARGQSGTGGINNSTESTAKRIRLESNDDNSKGPMVVLQNYSRNSGTVLMNTLKVKVKGKNGQLKTIRLVGDCGSERSYVLVDTLDTIKNRKIGDEWLQHSIFGGEVTLPEKHSRHVVTLLGINGETRDIELLSKKKITSKVKEIPKGPWIEECEKHGISLSDVGTDSSYPDILIGNDYWGMFRTGALIHLSGGLTVEETVFGWTLGGPIPSSNCLITATFALPCQEVERLWRLEAIGIRDPVEVKSAKKSEEEVMSQFTETIRRSEDGRYIIALPWKNGYEELPSNRNISEVRLKGTTFKLKKGEKYDDYNQVFQDWEKEGLIVKVMDSDQVQHILPHRPVFKESLTTPVRPVFDASCRQGRKPSLNDCLFTGPNLIELIPVMILRFGEKAVGVTADIRKAFQTIGVREEDQPFQRFLWWEDPTCKKVILFQHLRVVFGITCSPFLLGATIKHHLKSYPRDSCAEKLKGSFYVDNLVASVDTFEEGKRFQERSCEIMNEARMELRQWAFSVNNTQEAITMPDYEDLSNPKLLPILGIIWNREEDTLSCVIKDFICDGPITKRAMLSVLSQVFDPMGWLCPALLVPKLLVQETWTHKIGWDEPVSPEISKRFKRWVDDLPSLRGINIPRFSGCRGATITEVHLFADGSMVGMAAAAYLRTKVNGNWVVRLLMAKARLAPTSKPTIPRIELIACVLATRIATCVCEAWDIDAANLIFWTDSTTALAWIRRNGDWGPFVRNRVNEILTVSSEQQWRHVSGVNNPADLPSRGCSPIQLSKSTWWEGLDWMKQDNLYLSDNEPAASEEEIVRELKKTITLWTGPTDPNPPRFSSYKKNVAVWGWVLRFIDSTRDLRNCRPAFLTIDDLRRAEKVVIRNIQEESFPADCTDIGGIQVGRDQSGILRVKTRLSNRNDTADFKFPIVLPKCHPMVDLLIQDVHLHSGHGGVHFLLSKLRDKYWIIQSRRVVRRILRSCVSCRRHSAKNLEVEMASLPNMRVEDAEVFANTGVDLLGPLFLKNKKKVWVVLYTCAVYRAVELDIVSSLSAETFVRSLERFVSQHGRPNVIYSDNGTNFVKTANLLKQVNWNKVQLRCNEKQIRWSFNPPTAAWWGGFWERLVRSVKDLLKRILGRSKMTHDELRTCLAGVATTINDRPLTVVSEDDKELIPLTPNMFMKPRKSGAFHELGTSEHLTEEYRRMKEHQYRLQARFRKEYLGLLVHRSSKKRQDAVKVGDVVLVGADNKKRFEWPLGLVLQFFPSTDGKKRVARIKTANGELVRPIQRLYPLEVSQTVAGLSENSTRRNGMGPDSQDSVLLGKPHNKDTTFDERTDNNGQTTRGGILPDPVFQKMSDLNRINRSTTTQDADCLDDFVTRSGRRVKKPIRYAMWNN